MKNKIFSFSRAALAALLALTMLLSMALPALAAIELDHDKDDKISYVALGASNTNGFGLFGYLPDELYENPINKGEGNLYGYKMEPAAAYPALVQSALAELTGKEVELNQLAISSMRAEELRVLLDNDYYGDSYTEWRFTGGANWFNAAHPEGLNGLRAEYQEYVKNADIITVDIGANNFGVYASNRILNNMFDADFTRFTPETQETLAWVRSTVSSLVVEMLGNDDEMAPIIDSIVDTLTYAIVGFCSSFDESIERIYELNPDATVIVVNIQNLLAGVEAILPGQDSPIPLGELYGLVVNIANLYTAAMSPYADRYSYAYIGDDGEAETFLSDLAAYSGDPADLSSTITDCFDVYDNDMFLKTRVLQACAQMSMSAGKLSVKDGYTKYTLADVSDAAKFSTMVYDNALLIAGVDVQTFLANGATNTLNAEVQTIYDQYKKTLLTAYDAAATTLKLGTESNVIDLEAAASFATEGEKILLYFATILEESILNPDVDIETSDAFKALRDNPVARTIITLGIRTDIGNSFFSHPNENGHREIADCIINSLKKKVTSNYAKDNNSYYIALGDGVAAARKSYVSTFAKALGVDYKNLAKEKQTAADARDVVIANQSLFAKADLVTIDYSDAAITEFMFSQMDSAISGKRPAELDWNSLIGDAESLVDLGLDKIREMLVSQNLDVGFMGLNLTDLLLSGIEGYAYAYVTRLICYSDAIDAIKEYAPDALIVLVGTYNDFNNITFTMEGITLDISSYVEYIVTSLNLEGKLYAAIEPGRVIYVDAPDVESVFAADIADGEYSTITLMTYLNAVKKGELRPTAEGYAYIANQLLAGVPLHTHSYISNCATECSSCGMARENTTDHTYEHPCSSVCKLCSEKRADAAAHEFSEWTEQKPATETETGIETRACKHCGISESRDIPKLIPVETTPAETTPVETTPEETTPNETEPVVTTPVATEPPATTTGGCGGITVAAQLVALICAAGALLVIKKK